MKKLTLIMFILLNSFYSKDIFGQDFSELYKKVSKGVVVIETEEEEIVSNPDFKQKITVGGMGTGFMISENQVVTAAHVVHTAENIKVKFIDGEVIPGKVVSSYKNADVALVELVWKKKKPTILKMGDSDLVEIGNQVFIIGAPHGLEYSFSSGHISGRLTSNKVSSPFFRIEYFQTDAAINEGNSGGPMFNTKGEVIGVVSHILSNSGGHEGLGFASTSNIADRLLFKEHIAWSGIDGYVLTGNMAKIFNLPQSSGVLVQKVVFLSPLGISGVKGGDYDAVIDGEELILGGDIILSFNGIPFGLDEHSMKKLTETFKKISLEEKIELTVLRGGKIMKLNVEKK